MTSYPINSPFRYAGGKFYARKLIFEHIPPHQLYCEPLVGGGSVFFAKPKAPANILNDLDEELMNEIRKDLPDLPRVFVSSFTGQGLPALKDMLWKVMNDF